VVDGQRHFGAGVAATLRLVDGDLGEAGGFAKPGFGAGKGDGASMGEALSMSAK
jgi:hypothetical protein